MSIVELCITNDGILQNNVCVSCICIHNSGISDMYIKYQVLPVYHVIGERKRDSIATTYVLGTSYLMTMVVICEITCECGEC